MAERKPSFHELANSLTVTDIASADWTRLYEIERAQHALATGYGGAGTTADLHVSAVTPTRSLEYLVPPGVTHVDVTVVVSGSGTLKCTTDHDATGAELTWTTDQDDDPDKVTDVKSAGEAPGSKNASDGYAPKVRSSVAWSWSRSTMVFELTSGTGSAWSVLLEPIHVVRDV